MLTRAEIHVRTPVVRMQRTPPPRPCSPPPGDFLLTPAVEAPPPCHPGLLGVQAYAGVSSITCRVNISKPLLLLSISRNRATTVAVRRGEALTWRVLPCPGQGFTAPARPGQLGRPWQRRCDLGHGSAVETFCYRVLGSRLGLLSQDDFEGAGREKRGLDFLLEEEAEEETQTCPPLP